MKIKKYVLGMALGFVAATCAYGNAGSVQAATIRYSALKQTESTTEAATENSTKTTESTTSATEQSSEESTVVTDDKAKYKVKITITVDEVGWKSESADVNVKVEKIYGDKKFKIEKVEAKVGANGAYEDITDDMKLTITENCSVYISHRLTSRSFPTRTSRVKSTRACSMCLKSVFRSGNEFSYRMHNFIYRVAIDKLVY